jgi:hypothetical protein
MKKTTIWIISLMVLLALIVLAFVLFIDKEKYNETGQYSCNLGSDCVSQCRNGCVNSNWALSNPDASECFRAWDCSCVNHQCYTDGNPRE